MISGARLRGRAGPSAWPSARPRSTCSCEPPSLQELTSASLEMTDKPLNAWWRSGEKRNKRTAKAGPSVANRSEAQIVSRRLPQGEQREAIVPHCQC
jgi:hypothetical protein